MVTTSLGGEGMGHNNHLLGARFPFVVTKDILSLSTGERWWSCNATELFALKLLIVWNVPGSPVVRTPCFHCRGLRFDLWLGNEDLACCVVQPKK